MLLGGLLKFTLIDYPGKVAAALFTQGCNYRCPFCHNPELVLPDLFQDPLDMEEVFSFLEKRRGQLQGVVVTGGEPTIHADLADVLARIKAMGYLVKLDTNGSRPDVVQALVSARLVDYWAMDIKSSLENYCKATGVAVDIHLIKASIEAIKSAGVDHEFRTTGIRSFCSEADAVEIIRLVGPGHPYFIRRGNLKGKMIDKSLADRADYTVEEWGRIKERADGREARDENGRLL